MHIRHLLAVVTLVTACADSLADPPSDSRNGFVTVTNRYGDYDHRQAYDDGDWRADRWHHSGDATGSMNFCYIDGPLAPLYGSRHCRVEAIRHQIEWARGAVEADRARSDAYRHSARDHWHSERSRREFEHRRECFERWRERMEDLRARIESH